MIVQVMRNLEVGLLAAARRQKECAIWSALEAWLKPAIAVMFAIIFGATIQSVLLGYFIVVAGILFCFYMLPIQVEGVSDSKVYFESGTKLLNDIRKYSLPLVPLAVVAWIGSLGDRYIIGSLLGMDDVGIFSACYGLIGVPFLMIGAIIGQTLRPAYFQMLSTKNKIAEKRIFNTRLITTTLICAFGIVAICLLKNLIASLLLAKEYRNATLLMPWIAVGISFQVIGQIFEDVLLAYKRTGTLFLIHSIGAAICIASVYLLIKQFGLIGAAAACPVYYLSMLLISMFVAKNVEKT